MSTESGRRSETQVDAGHLLDDSSIHFTRVNFFVSLSTHFHEIHTHTYTHMYSAPSYGST